MVRGTREVLHNLRPGLLSQLPRGPVRELCLYAPFVDPTGKALSEIIDWFDPEHTSSSGCRNTGPATTATPCWRRPGTARSKSRLLPERFPRHGKLLEWEGRDGRHALTGSANLTQSALIQATASGGNCELAVLTPVGTSHDAERHRHRQHGAERTPHRLGPPPARRCCCWVRC